MHELIRILKDRVSNHPHKQTVRKIIIFKDSEICETCLLELEKDGITPYRWIRMINALCFHIKDGGDIWRKLEEHPRVHRVETDFKRRLDPIKRRRRVRASQIPWGVRRIGAPKVWECTLGEGVKVAILDTGISPHPDLVIAGGINIINPNSSFFDDDGHGTNAAGVVAAIGNDGMIFGVAPKAELYAVKADDGEGAFDLSAIVAGLEWTIENHMNVVNMSFGDSDPESVSEAERLMIIQAHRSGITMVAAAGNEGPNNKDGIDFPARFPEVIAVAATNKKNRIANFSDRGRGINVAAPGVDILTTDNAGGFEVVEGTSFSAPHVTGTVALMLANEPDLSPGLVREVLMETAKFLKGFRRTSQGAGLIRANLAVGECEGE